MRYNAIVVPVSWNVGLSIAIVTLDGGIVAFSGGNVVLDGGIFSVYLGNCCRNCGILLQERRKELRNGAFLYRLANEALARKR